MFYDLCSMFYVLCSNVPCSMFHVPCSTRAPPPRPTTRDALSPAHGPAAADGSGPLLYPAPIGQQGAGEQVRALAASIPSTSSGGAYRLNIHEGWWLLYHPHRLEGVLTLKSTRGCLNCVRVNSKGCYIIRPALRTGGGPRALG